MFFPKYAFYILALLVTVCLGCELPRIESTPVSASVSGKVLDGERPVPNAKILFLPATKHPLAKTRFAFASTNEEGRFTMRISPEEYGAYLGANLVVISTRVDEKAEEAIEPKQNGVLPVIEEGLKIIPGKQPEATKEPFEDAARNEATSREAKEQTASPQDSKLTARGKESSNALTKTQEKVVTRTTIKPETIPSRFNSESELMVVVVESGNSGIVFQVQDKRKSASTETPADDSKKEDVPAESS